MASSHQSSARALPAGDRRCAFLFGGVIYLLWTSPIPRVWRWVGTALSVLAVLGVAYSRVYLRAHWASDVVGGFVGGLAYLLLVLVAVGRRPAPQST